MYPSRSQEAALAQWLGHTRWVWNWALETRKKAYEESNETLTSVDLSKQITVLKGTEPLAWLADVPADCLVQKLRDLDAAYQAFFEGRARFPRFKSKHRRQSARVSLDHRHPGKVTAWSNGTDERPRRHIVLPRLGALHLRGRALPLEMPKMVTVSRDAAGRYWASFSVEETLAPAPEPKHYSVGVDAGARRLATLSDETMFENSRNLARYAGALRKAQQRLGRQCKGSNRRARTKRRVARIHARIADCRREALHRVTTRIVHESQVVCAETLGVKDMTKSAKGTKQCPGTGVKVKSGLNRALLDASMGELLRQLEYKCTWYARTFIKVPRDFPSSAMCHVCHEVNEELTLDDTEWTCRSCGTHHDRDVTAAKNIEAEGLRMLMHPEDTGMVIESPRRLGDVRAPGGEGERPDGSGPVAVPARIGRATQTLSGTA